MRNIDSIRTLWYLSAAALFSHLGEPDANSDKKNGRFQIFNLSSEARPNFFLNVMKTNFVKPMLGCQKLIWFEIGLLVLGLNCRAYKDIVNPGGLFSISVFF